MINGKQAEELFLSLLQKEGKVIKSATEQDMFEHWDFECNNTKYDVKTQKKFSRSDNNTSEVLWIELQNVLGNKGWLKGKADKLAFLFNDKFLIVDRKNLFNYVKTTIKDLTIYSYKQYKRWYRRQGRKDIITYLYLDDIKHLIEKEIKL